MKTKLTTFQILVLIGLAAWLCIVLGCGAMSFFAAVGQSSQTVSREVTRVVYQGVAETCPPAEPGKALPTYTPYPTYTPFALDFATPTMSPDFSMLYTFTGINSGTTDLFVLKDGMVRIKWDHPGDKSNFIVYLNRMDTNDSSLIANEIGTAQGQKIINVSASDQYLFDITSIGEWTITVEFR